MKPTLDERADRIMQACRIGCHSVESANDLLAECYGLIGALKAWKDEASVALKAAWLLERNGVIVEGINATWDPDDRGQMEHWRSLLIDATKRARKLSRPSD